MTSVKVLIVVLAIMNFMIFSGIMNKTPGLEKVSYTCLMSCKSDTCKHVVDGCRDSNYWLEPEGVKVDKGCLFSAWELTHLIFHIWVAYEFGFFISIYLSVMFEIYENIVYKCGSLLDIGWNAIGAFIGVQLKNYLSPVH